MYVYSRMYGIISAINSSEDFSCKDFRNFMYVWFVVCILMVFMFMFYFLYVVECNFSLLSMLLMSS